MLRLSSLTVNTLAVFGKRSVVTVMSSDVETSLLLQKTFRDSFQPPHEATARQATSLRTTSGSVLRTRRISSETVKRLAACWTKLVVSGIRILD
jgi:hypothetical protein